MQFSNSMQGVSLNPAGVAIRRENMDSQASQMSHQEIELRKILLPHIVNQSERERVIGRILPLIFAKPPVQEGEPKNPYPNKHTHQIQHDCWEEGANDVEAYYEAEIARLKKELASLESKQPSERKP